MKRTSLCQAISCLSILFVCLVQQPLAQQSASSVESGFRTEFLNHFNASSRKMLSLAEAMPAEKYSWRPGEGVMSVAEVFTHVAETDLHYVSRSLDRKPTPDLDPSTIGGLRDKDQVVAALRKTFDFVRQTVEQMNESDMQKTTTLYGRPSTYRNVLLQLLHHSSEHVGQSIAYARMNGIAPPWSR